MGNIIENIKKGNKDKATEEILNKCTPALNKVVDRNDKYLLKKSTLLFERLLCLRVCFVRTVLIKQC